MLNFIKTNATKIATAFGVGVIGLDLSVKSVMAACTPGTGELCAADLQPVLNAGIDRLKDTIVSFLTVLLPIIIVLGFFYVLYRWIRNHGRKA